jgi:hypothetical protein
MAHTSLTTLGVDTLMRQVARSWWGLATGDAPLPMLPLRR